MTDTLASFAQTKLDGLEAKALRRRLFPTHRLDGVHVERNGRRLISFSCNDYLGLSHHPAVKAAAARAIDTYGTGAGGSRLITGDTPLISRLEERLAARKGTEAACVFGSGYLANSGVIPTFVGPGDLILLDELAHACLWAGARLSGAMTLAFRHNDMADLAGKLDAQRAAHGRVLIGVDGVYSMDGDLAPLEQLSRLCQAHDAWLLVDDAHGLGVVGGGRGSAAEFPGARVHIQMGTLSKAIGGYGAYVCAARPVIDFIKTRTRTVVYSTGLPPACAASALAALDVMDADPALATLPLAKARRFTAALNLPEATSAVVPVILGEARLALEAAAALEAQGFLVVAIRPPTVPAGTARLRVAFCALHPDEAIDRLADAVRPWTHLGTHLGTHPQ